MHSPASRDYEQPEIRYLDILKQAERRGLDIIAFTDHNTANGYRNMQREIADLELLEQLGRIRADELGRLNEYRRLLKKLLVLPGFEVTATFGFHILGLFPPEKSLRDIDFILLQLRVPSHVVEQGLTEAGATSDVLTAYRLIAEAGGIAIAPHANSSSGVFMRGMNIGGQTRIAYTQDPNLSAIELTDLAKGRRSMASWFNGYKPEYSRRMHIIQSSDSHRLTASPTDAKRLGLGDRTTEVFLPELSFNALRDLFLSKDFDRERPADVYQEVTSDVMREAREKGNDATQCFHPALPRRGDKFAAIVNDVTALANTNGGCVYIGCDAGLDKRAAGVSNADGLATEIAEAVQSHVSPALNVMIDLQQSNEAAIVRIGVPPGDNLPYSVDGIHIYVRSGAETRLATREDVVALVRRAIELEQTQIAAKSVQEPKAAQHAPRHPQPGQHPGQPPQRRQQQPGGQGQTPRGAAQGQQQRSPKGQPQGRGEQQSRQQQQPRQQQPAATGPKPAQNGGGSVDTGKPETHAGEGAKVMQLPAPEPQVDGSPRSGVEILSMEERDGTRYFTVRDLRNKSVVRNVTQKSARDLWLYAINQHGADVYDITQVQWRNDRSILSRSQRAGKVRYDIVLRDNAGKVHIFYGVADDAMDSRWKELIQATMPPLEAEPSRAPASAPNEAQETNPDIAPVIDTGAESTPPVAESAPLSDNTPVSETQS